MGVQRPCVLFKTVGGLHLSAYASASVSTRAFVALGTSPVLTKCALFSFFFVSFVAMPEDILLNSYRSLHYRLVRDE